MKHLLLWLTIFIGLGCSNTNSPQTSPYISSEEVDFQVDTLATGLEHPWGMAFLPDGRILIAERPGTLRIWEEGQLSDTPVSGLPEIWSYGHRNIQGMKLHPVTRELWAVEHGPKGGDEINRIHKGGNYGWPEVTHGVNYDGSVITPDTTKPGMIDPILHWTPSIAPCGMDFVDSDLYPGWEGNMMVGALANQHIHRVVFSDTTVVHTEKLLEGMARFRTVKQGPDGYLYVLTESPGLFFRMVPR